MIKGLLPKSWAGFRDTSEGALRLPGTSNSLESYLSQGSEGPWEGVGPGTQRNGEGHLTETVGLVGTCQEGDVGNKYPDFTLFPPSQNPVDTLHTGQLHS